MYSSYKLFLLLLICIFYSVHSTEINQCNNKKYQKPLFVRVQNCEIPPCIVLKERDIFFDIQFVALKYVTNMTAKVRAYALGIGLPYVLPKEVADVCTNLLDDAICPLYETEDVVYHFQFPVGTYPEISLPVEISLEDQDNVVHTCFRCTITVKQPEDSLNNATYYQIDF